MDNLDTELEKILENVQQAGITVSSSWDMNVGEMDRELREAIDTLKALIQRKELEARLDEAKGLHNNVHAFDYAFNGREKELRALLNGKDK